MTSSVSFPAYTFTWCSSTSVFAGVKRYLRYTSSGSCFQPSFPNLSSSSPSVMECSTTTTGIPSRSSFRFPCFFFGLARETSSGSSVLSSAATASDSLKNTIFPSTSIKETWPSASCFSDDLPNLCRFKSAICSRTSWSVWSIFSSCSCCDRNSLISVSRSRLFSCSSVYFEAMLFSPGILIALLYHGYGIFANPALPDVRHNACG